MFRFKETVLEWSRLLESKSILPLTSRNVNNINLWSAITVSHMATLTFAKMWMYKQDSTCRMSGASINVSHWSMKYSLNPQIACFLLIIIASPPSWRSSYRRETLKRNHDKWLPYFIASGSCYTETNTDGIYSLSKNQWQNDPFEVWSVA